MGSFNPDGTYTAGNAVLKLSPKLPSDFAGQVKKQLAPINESLTILLKPKLTDGFKSQVETLVKGATQGVKATVEVKPKLSAAFRKDLQDQVKAASTGVEAKIGVKLDDKQIKNQLKAKTQALPDLQLGVKLDFKHADAQLAEYRAKIDSNPINMGVNVDTTAATAQLVGLRSLAANVGDKLNNVNISSSSSSTVRGTKTQVQDLTGNIFTRPIKAIKLQVQLDNASVARAEADVAAVAAKLETARQGQATATDRVAVAEARYSETMAKGTATESRKLSVTQARTKAYRDLATAASRVDTLGGDADRAATSLFAARNNRSSRSLTDTGVSAFASATGDGIRTAVQSMTSMVSVAGLAKVALIGLAAVSLVPLIGQLAQAAGVVALLPAAFAGAAAVFATVKIGIAGIADAWKAADKMQTDSADETRDKAKAVADAQKQAKTASEGVANAEQGIGDAERGVGDAQREAISAQNDLTKARKDATRQLQDLNTELNRGRLDEEGAAISVAEAQRDLVKALADPKADTIDRAAAQHRLNEAYADQQDVITKIARTQQDANEANRKGVEGSDQVVSAKDRVTKAAEGQQKAQEQLGNAQTKLADAQSNLADSQKNLADVMAKATPSVDAFQKIFGKLAPNAQDFIQKMIALKPHLDDFKHAVQNSLFDKMGDTFSSFANNWLPNLKTGFTGVATEINHGVRKALTDLDNDATRSKVSGIFDKIKASIVPTIEGIDNLIQGILSLTGVGSNFLPGLSNTFLSLTEKFRAWAQSPEGQTAFHDFIKRSLTAFGQITDLIQQIGRLIGSLFSGSAPTGQSWIQSLTDGAKKWADFLGTPEGQKKLQDFFDNVKTIVEDIAGAIKDAAGIANTITSTIGTAPTKTEKETNAPKPGGGVLNDIYNFENLSEVPTLPGKTPWDMLWIGDKGLMKQWASDVKSEFSNVSESIGMSLFAKIPQWKSDFTGWIGNMGSVFGTLPGAFNNVIKQLTGQDILGSFKSAFSSLPGFFGRVVSDVSSSWTGIGDAMTGPINAVIDMLNKFGDLWNKAASFLGLKNAWTPIPHVGVQNAQPAPVGGGGGDSYFGPSENGGGGGDATFATGGLVSGGIPGRDSVRGLLMPDEVVMSVPAVKAAGRDNLLRFNAAALNGHAPTEGLLSGGHLAMASGGAVQDAIDKAKTFVQGEAGKPYQYGGVGDPSWDCSGLWSGIVNVLQGRSATSGRQFTTESDFQSMGWTPGLSGPVTVGIMRGGGGEDSHMAGTLSGDNAESRGGDGVLFGPQARGSNNSLFGLQYTLRDFVGKYTSGGPGGPSGSGLFGGLRSALVDRLLGTPLRALVNQVPTFNNLGYMGEIPKALISKVADSAINFAKGNAGGSTESTAAGTGPIVNQVKAAFAKYGWGDGAEWDAANWIIGHESSWNPTAVNPSSGAFGLPQFLGSTKDQYLPDSSTNPGVQGDAMARYIKDRYGDPLAAQKFWQSYGWYDDGGIFPHNTIGINQSGKPEAVLTNPQWKLFQDFAANLPHAIDPAVPAPVDPTANFAGVPGATDALANPGVDTGATLAAKGVSRFKNAFTSGLSDMISANLGPLGIPDPREIPVVKAATDIGTQFDAWQKAKAAGVQASQMLGQVGYTGVPATTGTTAEAATGATSTSAGTIVNNDNSTVINIQTADVNGAFQKAQQIQDLRALQHTARG